MSDEWLQYRAKKTGKSVEQIRAEMSALRKGKKSPNSGFANKDVLKKALETRNAKKKRLSSN